MVKQGSGIDDDCSGWLDVGDTGKNEVDYCVSGVKAEASCRNTFFYAPSKGWCVCEKKGEKKCEKKASDFYNEYRLIVGA